MMDRIIFMGVPVNDYVANVILGTAFIFESTDPKRDIQMFNSPEVQQLMVSDIWQCNT